MGVTARFVATVGALALAGALATPADAAIDPINGLAQAVSDSTGVDYTCTAYLLGGVLSQTGLPLHIDELQTVTVPTGGVVTGLTAQAGLTTLVDELADVGLGAVFGVSSLALRVGDGVELVGTIASSGKVTVPSFTLPGGATTGAPVPITAPTTLVLPLVSGVLGSLSCVLDDAGSDVLGTVLVGPATTDTTIHKSDPPGQSGGGTGARTTTVVSARLVDRVVVAGRHARVKVRVRAARGTRVSPQVTVGSAERTVGRARLRNGAATVRIALLRPGLHRLRVRVAGLSERLTLRVVR